MRSTRSAKHTAPKHDSSRGYFTRAQAWLSLIVAPLMVLGVMTAGFVAPANADDATPTPTSSQPAGPANTDGTQEADPVQTTPPVTTPAPTDEVTPPVPTEKVTPPVTAEKITPPAPDALLQTQGGDFSTQATCTPGNGTACLTMIKNVVPDGMADPAAWTLTAKYDSSHSYSFTSGDILPVYVGSTSNSQRTYTVSETGGPSDPNFGITQFSCTGADSVSNYNRTVTLRGNANVTCTLTNTTTTNIATTPNPPLAASCGLDFTLVLDTSGSIGDTGMKNLKLAADAFVESLANTGSRISISSFSTTGVERLQTTELTTANLPTIKDSYKDLTSNDRTNWQDGLIKAQNTFGGFSPDSKPDLVVMITDGKPNTLNRAGGGTIGVNDGDPAATNPAIALTNAMKVPSGIHIFGIGVGSGIDTSTINLLTTTSNPVKFNGDNFPTADYLTSTDYSTLKSDLQKVVVGLCGGSVTIHKQIDTNGTLTDGDGWTFTGTSNGTITPATSVTGSTGLTGAFKISGFTSPSDTKTGTFVETNPDPSQYTLEPQSGKNAVCTQNGSNVAVTNATNGFTIKNGVGPKDIITCTVINKRTVRHTVTLQKAWTNPIAGDTTTLSINGGTGVPVVAPDTAAKATASFAQGSTVTLSETAVTGAGSYTPTLVCDQGVTPTGTNHHFTMPNADVICTFTNTNASARVTVNKQWSGAIVGDTAGISLNGTTNTATATNENTWNPSVGSGTFIVGAPITLNEVLPAEGKTNAGSYTKKLACTGVDGVSIDAQTFTMPATAVDCTYTNTNNTAKITLNKVWVNSHTGDSTQLTINNTLAMPSTAPTGASMAAAVNIGSNVTVAEALDVNNKANYDQVLSCTDGKTTWATASFPMPNADVTCTYTNTATTGTVHLQKNWQSSVAGDTVDLKINLNVGSSSASTGTNGIDSGHVATATASSGALVNASEAFTTKNGVYESADLKCDNATPSENGTFTMPKTGDVTCTITNTGKTGTVQLTKTWINGVKGDAAQLQVNNSPITKDATSTATGANPQVDTDHVASAVVPLGSQVTLNEELLNPNTPYTSAYTCGSDITVTDATFTMPKSGNVTCVVTNTASTASVTLTKNWVNGVQGDTVKLKINGDALKTSVSTGATGTVIDSANTASAQASVGSIVTLGEEFTTKNGSYTTEYVCTGATPAGEDNHFTMPAGNVACNVINLADTAQVTVTKTWVGGVKDDVANLSITSPGATPATSTSTAAGGDQVDSTGASTAVPRGATVTVGETFGTPKNGSYATAYECTNGETNIDLTDAHSFTMPKTGTVDCVITNTAKTAEVTLTKTWVGGVKGDTANLQINGKTGATSTSTGGDQADPTQAKATVSTGSIVNIGETFGTKNGNYAATYDCTNVEPTGQSFRMPASGAVSCVVTNTAVTASVSLFKTWDGGVAGDTAGLQINGSTPTPTSTSTATGGDQQDLTHYAAATVSTGSTVTLGEILSGNGSYTPAYQCNNGVTPEGDDNHFTMPEGTVKCEVINVAAITTVSLAKTWVAGVQGDQANLQINGVTGATSTSTGGDQVDPTQASAIVSTGSIVKVGETFGTHNGSYETTYECADGENTVPLSETNTFPVPDSGTVSCVVTNTAATAQVTLSKSWTNGVAGDVANLSIASPGAATGTSSSTATGAPGTVHDTTEGSVATATVSRGAIVTLDEAFGTKNGTYATSYECTGAVVTGTTFQMPETGTVDCIVTNSAVTADVTLTKTWVGGVKDDAAALTIAVPGTPGATHTSVATGGNQTDKSGASMPVSQGARVTVGETINPHAGSYTPSYRCTDGAKQPIELTDNTFTMPQGAVDCVVTNTLQTATLTLVKNVQNLNGGAATANDWTLTAAGDLKTVSGNPAKGSGTGPDIENQVVPIGTYALSETGTPAGYTLTDLTCTVGETALPLTDQTVTLALGQNVTCTYTNTDSPATWTVKKSSEPASGSTVKPGDTITYKVNVTNTGGAIPASLTLTDDLSNVLDHATMGDITEPDGSTATVSGTTLTWKITSFTAGPNGTETLKYQVKVNEGAWGVTLKNVVTPPKGGECVEANDCTTEHFTPAAPIVPALVFTGSDVGGILGLGGILAGLGALLLFLAFRRRRANGQVE